MQIDQSFSLRNHARVSVRCMKNRQKMSYVGSRSSTQVMSNDVTGIGMGMALNTQCTYFIFENKSNFSAHLAQMSFIGVKGTSIEIVISQAQ